MANAERGAGYGSTRTARLGRVTVVLALICSLFVVAPPAAFAAPFTVSFDSTTSSVSESGTSIAVTVVLSTGGAGVTTNGSITVEVINAATGTAGGTDFSYTNVPIVFPGGSGDGATDTATVTITSDGDHEADETIDLDLSVTDPGVDGATAVSPTSHEVTILDDDPVTVSFSQATSSNVESGTNTTTVALSVPGGGTLASGVTVDIVDDGTGNATLVDDYTLTTTSVTFGAGAADAATMNVDVAIVADDVDESDETVDLSLSVDSGPALVSGTHEVTILDDDTAGVTVSTPSLSVTEGGASMDYSVVLDSQPTGSVTIGAASTTGEATVTPASRTFNATNWDSPKTFTVEAFDDAAIDGTTGDTIVHTATSGGDAQYDAISTDDVVVTVNDDDSAGVTLSKSILSITEGGADGTYTVVLTSAPTDNVVITPSDANGNVLITPTSRTFTPGNWNTPKQFSVTVTNDDIAEGSRADTISHAAQSNDNDYDGLAIGNVAVSVDDDDVAGVTVSTATVDVTEGQPGVQYTVVLTSEPTSNVVVTVGGNTGEAAVSPGSRTFNSTNWDSAKTFTITAVDDGLVDGATTDVIDHSASGDPAYAALSIDSVDVNVTDDDVVGVTVSEANLSITEGGGGDTYTVVLDSQPAGDVTITPSDTDGEVMISPPSLTFDAGDWDSPKMFTVTAPNNPFADGNRTDTVTHAATSVADPAYDGATVADVDVAISDDEGPAVASIDDVSEIETDGTVIYTFTISVTPASAVARTVRLRTEPAGVDPASPSEYEAITNQPVNIPAQASSVTVDIEAYGDNLTENDERFQAMIFNPSGALTLGDATGRGTILDDDADPVGNVDTYNVDEGGTLVTTVGNGVLVNDTDADDGQGGLTALKESNPDKHVGGFTLASDGGFTYTHDGSAGATDSFTYRAGDGSNQSAVTTVTINIDNVAPVVDAGPDPAPVTEGVSVPVNATFVDPGLGDSHAATIDWGDGAVDNCPADCTITFNNGTGNGTVAGSHSYAATAVYTVTVTVDDGDDTGFDNLTVTVQNANFIVDAGDDQSIDEGDTVPVTATFDDADGSSNHSATIDWGDGSAIDNCPGSCTIVDNGDGTGTVTGSHQYDDNGAFTVTVRVFDGSGDEGFGGFTSNVANVIPVADIDGPTSGDEGDLIELHGRKTDPGDDSYDWSWQVTRDGEFYAASTKKNLDLVVDDNGEYEYTLVVTDDDGGVSDPATHTVTVANVNPVAQITDTDGNVFPASSNGGEEGAKLKLRSSIDDPGADEFVYQWAIRLQGQLVASSTTDRINYTPVENGVFFVTLIVDDDDGGSSFRSVVITIDNAPPVIEQIAFDATPAVGALVDMDVFWSDAGTEDTHTVTVDWGEGPEEGKAGTSPVTFDKTYGSAGTRSAEVCVQDDDGGKTCETFYVNPGATSAIDSDFNGDGYEDLAIGVPGEDGKAGAVNVLYGSPSGINTAGDDIWKQGVDGIAGSGEAGDGFGSTLAWGDFDLDGYSDLAIGVPREGISGEAAVGVVHVLYGSSSGLSASGDATFNQDTFGVAGGNQPGDRFGSALAAGDYNGDGFADLAVGVPYEDIDGVSNTGRVGILFGSPTGLTSTGDESWDQNSPGIKGANSSADRFGETLAAGDFDLDGFWDLAIGAPRKAVGGQDKAGSLLVVGGSLLGLDSGADHKWDQDTGTMKNVAEAGDRFTASLETGDFNGDGRPDLAIGIPDESVSGKSRGGAVAVMLGGSSGLSDAGNTLWHEDVSGVLGSVQAKDRFGFALAAGDFNDDGRDDLAIGVPYQDVSGKSNAGDVAVLLGGANGLKTAGDQRWNEDSTGIKGKSNKADHLGWALRALDHNGDGAVDLAIGIPDENESGNSNAGAVLVLRGRSGGITGGGDTYWTQDTPGVREATGKGDRFGRVL